MPKITLFGIPRINIDGSNSNPPRKFYLLLAFLALTPNFRIKRNHIAGFIWENAALEQANTNLRQLLARVKKVIPKLNQIIEIDSKELAAGPSLLQSDLVIFQSQFNNLKDLNAVESVLKSYCGELLADAEVMGNDSQFWLTTERSRLDSLFITMALHLLSELTRFGRCDGITIEQISERLLDLAPYDTEVHSAISEAFLRAGKIEANKRFQIRIHNLNAFEETPEPHDLRDTVKFASHSVCKATQQFEDNDNRRSTLFFSLPQEFKVTKMSWIYRAFAEDVINCLSRFKTFAVMAAHSAFVLSESQKESDNSHLRTDYSVICFVKPQTQIMSFRLYDNGTQRVLWSAEYRVDSDNLGSAFEVLTSQIAMSLADVIEHQSIDNSKFRSSKNVYQSFLTGINLSDKCTLPALRKARKAFASASSGDNTWAEAKARVAQTILLEWLILGGDDPHLLHKCKAEVKEALQIDHSDGTSHWMSAVLALYQRNYEVSSEAFIRAESLQPHSADLLLQHADALSHFGQIDESLSKFKKAIKLNPIAPDRYWWAGAGIMFRGKHYAEAVQMCGRMQDVEPAIRILTASLALAGETEKAKKYARRVKENYPGLSAQEIVRYSPDSDPNVTKNLIEGLRCAGIS